jgi:predicted nucleic acid-binding protein
MSPKLVTLDSSVIVTALRKQEVHHSVCRFLLEEVHQGRYLAIEPNIVLVEIAAAIKRRTGSSDLSKKVTGDLRSLDTFFFMDLDAVRTNLAIEMARQCSIRGMDAIVAQTSREFKTTLISLDIEMVSKLKTLVDCRMPSDFTRGNP